MPVTVRAADPADAAGIARVHVAGWQHGYAGLLPQEFLDRLSVEESTQRRRRSLLEPAEGMIATLVAERDDEIVGFVNVGTCRDDGAAQDAGELWAIYVHPDHWGSGAGYALHERSLRVLRDAGMSGAVLWVLAGNERAARFYRRQGWTADGAAKTVWRDDVRLDEVRYRHDL